MTAMNTNLGRAADRAGGSWDGPARAPARRESRADGREHDEKLATALGWFSIGLGLTQLLATRGFARFIGVPDDRENRAVLRMVGLRELTCGVGILTRPRPAGWLWARVGGDAMDLAMLGRALSSDRTEKSRVAVATLSVVGVTALDVQAGPEQSTPRLDDGRVAVGSRSGREAVHHDPPFARGTLPILARLPEPAALHATPRIRRGDR
jgi:hypothetical protein